MTTQNVSRIFDSKLPFVVRRTPIYTCALGLVMALGCESPPEETPDTEHSAGTPMAHLSDAALARFQAGASEFNDAEGSGEGLGPLFNGGSCAQCHNSPVTGGAGIVRITRIACRERPSDENTLIHLFSTRPDLGSSGVPSHCDAVAAQRRTTSLLGAGLLEGISDRDIEALADAQPSEIAGRPAYVKDLVSGKRRVGHFGWKAQHATLHAFAGDAYRNEMGITNELFPTEVAPAGDASLLVAMDPTPDPEAEVGSLERLADFMRLLAAPKAKDGYEAGAELFAQVGCDSCHYSGYVSASSEPALDGMTVHAYSDLLLHDIGTGDGIAQAGAGENEMRTPPLWGVRHAQLWLHDGRAASIDEAIRMHAGQALSARTAYEQLHEGDREELIAFLNSL